MSKVFYKVGIVLSFVFSMFGADTPLIFQLFRSLPQEIQKKIFDMASDTTVNSYPVAQNDEEYLILPTTTPIHPIRSVASRAELAGDFSVKPGEACCPHAQCWVKKTSAASMETNYQPKFRVRLDNDVKKLQSIFHLPFRLPFKGAGQSFFDGINGRGFGFYALQYSSGESCCAFLHEKVNAFGRGFTNWDWEFTHKGSLRSCTYQHDTHRVFLATDNPDINTAHALMIYEIDIENRTTVLVGKITSPHAINKTVCFGNNIFACVKDENTLRFFSFYNKKITFFPCSSRTSFKNIAVNPNYMNKNGFRYRFAIQSPMKEDKTADIFMCDLTECYKPALLYTCTIPNADLVKNFYYEGDEIRVVYHDAQDSNKITHIDVYKDNFTALWFMYMLRHYGKEKKIQ